MGGGGVPGPTHPWGPTHSPVATPLGSYHPYRTNWNGWNDLMHETVSVCSTNSGSKRWTPIQFCQFISSNWSLRTDFIHRYFILCNLFQVYRISYKYSAFVLCSRSRSYERHLLNGKNYMFLYRHLAINDRISVQTDGLYRYIVRRQNAGCSCEQERG